MDLLWKPKKQKITIVHQELELIPDLSIAENIFLGNYPMGKSGGGLEKDICGGAGNSEKIFTGFKCEKPK